MPVDCKKKKFAQTVSENVCIYEGQDFNVLVHENKKYFAIAELNVGKAGRTSPGLTPNCI